MADLTQGKTYSSSSLLAPSLATANAFDNDDSTQWHSTNSGINWIKVYFGDPTIINKIVYCPEYIYQFTPILQGSNDDITYTDVYQITGTLTSGVRSTFEFANTTPYTYYRFIANSKGYFNAKTLEMHGEVYIATAYFLSGTYETEQIHLDSQSNLIWTKETPTDTNIKVETSLDQIEWVEQTNGNEIDSGDIYIKITLSTEDTTKTPILKDIWLEEAIEPPYKILITMQDYKRFNNVEGDLTVAYDNTIGVLTGSGGFVKSFEESFIPLDLENKPNPHDAEKIILQVNAEVELKKINYNNRFTDGKFVISVDCTIAFINIDDLNP